MKYAALALILLSCTPAVAQTYDDQYNNDTGYNGAETMRDADRQAEQQQTYSYQYGQHQQTQYGQQHGQYGQYGQQQQEGWNPMGGTDLRGPDLRGPDVGGGTDLR